MNISEKVVRRLAFHSAQFARRLLGAKALLLTYPEQPCPGTALWKVAKLLGWKNSSDLGDHQRAAVVFRWEDTTYAKPWPADCGGKRIFNRDVCDISKNRLDVVHGAVFGYTLGVDGKSWQEPMVLKSVENARHNGRVVTGPLPAIPERTMCQRVVDNTDGSGGVVDLRVVYFDGEIPFGYRKVRPVADRFSNTNHSASLINPAREFSVAELENIVKVAQLMRLDVGELDVLRDKSDGKIYVCDVNTTPFGPPNNMSQRDWSRAVDLYCWAFVRMIECINNPV